MSFITTEMALYGLIVGGAALVACLGLLYLNLLAQSAPQYCVEIRVHENSFSYVAHTEFVKSPQLAKSLAYRLTRELEVKLTLPANATLVSDYYRVPQQGAKVNSTVISQPSGLKQLA